MQDASVNGVALAPLQNMQGDNDNALASVCFMHVSKRMLRVSSLAGPIDNTFGLASSILRCIEAQCVSLLFVLNQEIHHKKGTV